jgi:hypothetical protein
MTMTKSVLLKSVTVLLVTVIANSCSKININDEQAVIKNIQGTWIGYENTGTFYQHIKLNISENSFDGWVQISDSEKTPSWDALPGETGTYTLTSVQDDPAVPAKFRKFSFTIPGRCCGDKSLTIQTLSRLLTYVEGKGLYVGGKVSMIKK